MWQPATPSAEVLPTRLLHTLGRHQLGAFAATAVDFASMILFVECLGVPPTAAAALGASLGAIVNFVLGRTWIFRPHTGHPAAQAARYAIVAAASAGLNAGGEHLLHDVTDMQYVAARILGSIAISLLWNFPMQRHFVFRERGHRMAERSRPTDQRIRLRTPVPGPASRAAAR
jgi:putative flippase GtrA